MASAAAGTGGRPPLRSEDPPLLRGEGRYVGDLGDDELAGAATVAFVRSPFAHARVEGIDLGGVADRPDVVAAVTSADLDLAPPSPRMPWVPAAMARPWLADDRVRFVGEPVVMLVCADAATAEDVAEEVVVDYEPLDPVIDPETALDPGAPVLFPGHGDNLACEFITEEPAPDLFDGCEVVVEGRVRHQRLAACPLEGRATAARWDGERLTVWASSQNAHGFRAAMARAVGLPDDAVRVVVPDVGGGFGPKISPTPEELLVGWAARRLGRAVRWVETRSENMLAMGHGRAQVHRYRLGGSRDGRLHAYRLEVVADAGAYPAMAAYLPTFTRLMAPGTYDIGRVESDARVVVTNTMSVEAYRGAGRPEATATIEAAVDAFAAEVGIDPVEVRRRNLVDAGAFPHTTPTGAVYDSGDYRGALDKVVAAAAYEELRAEQERRRRAGVTPWLGIGVSTYVEITAGGGAPKEYGAVRIESDGTVTVRTGSSPHGQGHHTSFALLVSERLGIHPDRIRVVHGDTDEVPRGQGTMGSRSLQAGGSAVVEAAGGLLARARTLAARALGVTADDVAVEDGRLVVAGEPARAVDWTELASMAAPGELSVEVDFRAEGPTFPFGAHLAVVEVDPETGAVHLVRHVACDDAGPVLHQVLFDGQRRGGIAQGVGQALYEEFRYDEDGNPQTANFADYAIPGAVDLGTMELVGQETPSPFNPLGVKGVGESGTIGSTPAVVAAVVDALAPLGVRHLDMPATPARVWAAIHAAGGDG